MPIEKFHHHLADGDIVVYAGQHTVGFLKHLTVDHYPGITLFGGELRDDEGAYMLEQVYEKMPKLRKRKVLEGGDEDWEFCLMSRSGEKRQRR